MAPLKAGKMKSCLAGVGAGVSPARVLAAAVAACLTLNGLVVAWTPHAVLPLRPGTSAVLCRCAASIPCRLSRTWCRPSAPRACACACRGSHAKIILPCRPTGAGRVTGSRLAAPAAFESACGCVLVPCWRETDSGMCCCTTAGIQPNSGWHREWQSRSFLARRSTWWGPWTRRSPPSLGRQL